MHAFLVFGWSGDIAGGPIPKRGTELDMPFYVWASVIQDGRHGPDYAPDTGWLVATPESQSAGLVADPRLTRNPHPNCIRGHVPARRSLPGPSLDDRRAGWTVVGETSVSHVGGLRRDDGETGIRIVMVDNIDTRVFIERARAGTPPASSRSSRVCHRSTYG